MTFPLFTQYGVEDHPAENHCTCLESVGGEYELCLDELCNRLAACEYTSYDQVPTSLLLLSESSEKNDVCLYSLVYQPTDIISCLEECQCIWNLSLSCDAEEWE